MADDSYKTIKQVAEGYYTEKRSRFISYAIPVRTVEEVKEQLNKYRKQYYDARHVCWAYMVGASRTEFLSSDNGEPSGTAGKPILGQINSMGLTDVVVIVVRYFGGIKLGTGGLISAYREAAKEALLAAEIIERHVEAEIGFTFPYLSMNDVMKITKQPGIKIVGQQFDNTCHMILRIRQDNADELRQKLDDIDGVCLD